jgi:uncharacterized membrane protein YqaE (UPF0057 family)
MMDNEVKKQDVDETSFIAILLAILFPPLGVAVKCGLKVDFLVNVLLTLLGFIPGIVHALYVILKK